ncbi:hypothetical protein Rsub_04889 [Raphidocelis subcapitata]|uniref:Uncharacterized protein n=1 Tax=Raphidocelis subcapitata TaxID=307507 RepID=A0A2V0NVW6_9CHLO|nr:hypothetical protein Rsub_04889 [Raphidocelis subcapitata]|eukprot:GBF91784.1 hypothetical protein Rsub_04889 [Raphidocelis subcapitata]
MSDIGTKFDMQKATAGEEQPKRGANINMADAKEAQEVAKREHAYATTSEEDRPLEMVGNHHHHEHPQK